MNDAVDRCARLEPSGAVAFRGPDARRFLNGMLTHNVRDLPVGSAQRTALLDDRGRVLGLLRLGCAAPDRFVAFPDGGERAALATRFARFLVFDDVEVDALAFPAAFHLFGPGAAARIERLGLPATSGFAEQGPVAILATDRFGAPGWDVWGHPPPIEPITDEEATRLRVRSGRVVWPDDVAEKRLVHELGLRETVLSFEKGCYIGQETVNRVDVMGGVKKRLAGIVAAGPVSPGDAVYVGDDAVGALGSVSGHLALAVLRIPADEPGTEVHIGDARIPARTAAFPLPLQ